MVQAVLAAFPGAEIREVRPADPLAAGRRWRPATTRRRGRRLGSERSLLKEIAAMLKGLGQLGDMAKIMKQAQEMQ